MCQRQLFSEIALYERAGNRISFSPKKSISSKKYSKKFANKTRLMGAKQVQGRVRHFKTEIQISKCQNHSHSAKRNTIKENCSTIMHTQYDNAAIKFRQAKSDCRMNEVYTTLSPDHEFRVKQLILQKQLRQKAKPFKKRTIVSRHEIVSPSRLHAAPFFCPPKHRNGLAPDVPCI